MSKQQHWSLIAERGSYLGIWLLMKINQLTGRWLIRLVLWPVVFYFFLTGKRARAASKQFLTQVYDYSNGTALKKPPNWFDSLKHLVNFAESALDKIEAWSGKMPSDTLSHVNRHIFQELTEQKQGAVFIGSHLGNLEVSRALSKNADTRFNVMVFTQHAEQFNRILKKLDPNMDVNLIQVTEVSAELAIMLKQRIDNGEHLVIAADRTSTSSFGRVTEVPFLGKMAPISEGPFILAMLMDCPVYMMFCFKQKAGFEVILEPFERPFSASRKGRAELLKQQISNYVARLTHYCLLYPYQWYNFFDFWLSDDEVQRAKALTKES